MIKSEGFKPHEAELPIGYDTLIDPDTRQKATKAVCGLSRDAEDARYLLVILGLLSEE